MDHQINADTLRRYLPAEENQQGLVLRNPAQEAGKDYSHEIGILYNMVMQNKKDLEELRTLLKNGRDLEIAAARKVDQPAPSIEIPSREAEDVLPVEEGTLRIDEVEREQIRRALDVSGGNRKVAADKLGISERTLYRKIKEYGL